MMSLRIAFNILFYLVFCFGIGLAVLSFRSAALHQRKFFRELSKFDESLFDKLKEQEVDTLRKLYYLEGPSEIRAVSEVLWNKDWAANYIPQWTADAGPDLVISTEQGKYIIANRGQELMTAIDRELASRLRNRQTSQPGFTIAQIIREEDLRGFYKGLVEYNIAHQDEKFVDLRTFIGVLNAFLGEFC